MTRGDKPREPDVPKVYGVPRRYKLSTIFVVTTVCAVVLAACRAARIPAERMVAISLFFAVVAVAQAVLFGGRRPRLASVIAGIAITSAIHFYGTLVVGWPPAHAHNLQLMSIATALFLGVSLGYLAGGLAAGVFLVLDKLDARLARREPGQGGGHP